MVISSHAQDELGGTCSLTTQQRKIDREIVAALERRRGFTTEAARAVLRATEMLGLGIAAAAAKARADRGPMAGLYGGMIEVNARAGWYEELAMLLLARMRRYRAKAAPRGPGHKVTKLVGRILRAKRPGHIWMLDLTEIRGLFDLFKFKLAVVIDVFSRMPMLGQVFMSDPSGEQMAKVVELAAAKRGAPSHFVTDQGPQFTSSEFRERLAALQISQRFLAIGKSGSVAIIER